MTAKIYALDSVQTLADFELDAIRVADVIREQHGVAPGDRVILKAGNSAAYVSVLFALMHVGASIVLIDQQEHPDETRRIAGRTGAAIAFVDDDSPIHDDGRVVNLYEVIAPAAGRPLSTRELSFDAWADRQDGLIMWTSGSTGEPKGAVKSGRKFLTNLERNAAQVGHREDDVLLPLLPFAHQYGLSMVLIAWLTRCSLVIAPYKRLDRAVQMAGRTGATVLDATPSSYRTMLNLVGRKPSLRAQLEQVRMFCSGAAPLDGALSDGYVAEFGLPLLDSYGSTELGNIAFATLENPVSCGRAMDGIKLRIIDESGVPAAPGQAGEIEVDTPDALEGHLAEDGGLDAMPTGWFPTGDLGYLDEDDNLFVLGRKFAVHRYGYLLYPELVERKAAVAHISTRIVPLPDERRRGDVQLVFFVEDDERRDAKYWRERLCDVLPVYEQPNRVEVLDAFPLNRNGKPDKKRLEEIARG
ncbi:MULTISPECIES: class I adenylate-forming enzyme family protein [Streptomyces]|uniref:Long-chain fatty acid--CoA ligase n=1 Tax=Streptomyces botrytidirepellens TaxID=2486417 RepID=A0A3M8W8W5_9ACTN|nr:class I adenylate-forming enzyme family protein [Streptomyces botrytidirepellens]RNG25069.1 long-chain fatty acid--CoA ligase [Streptomyces botrytidirepellens]